MEEQPKTLKRPGFKTICKDYPGYETQAAIAETLNCSRPTVGKWLKDYEETGTVREPRAQEAFDRIWNDHLCHKQHDKTISTRNALEKELNGLRIALEKEKQGEKYQAFLQAEKDNLSYEEMVEKGILDATHTPRDYIFMEYSPVTEVREIEIKIDEVEQVLEFIDSQDSFKNYYDNILVESGLPIKGTICASTSEQDDMNEWRLVERVNLGNYLLLGKDGQVQIFIDDYPRPLGSSSTRAFVSVLVYDGSVVKMIDEVECVEKTLRSKRTQCGNLHVIPGYRYFFNVRFEWTREYVPTDRKDALEIEDYYYSRDKLNELFTKERNIKISQNSDILPLKY